MTPGIFGVIGLLCVGAALLLMIGNCIHDHAPYARETKERGFELTDENGKPLDGDNHE